MLHTQPIFDIAVLAAAYFVMLFVEPIFLHFFGTTPGKAIFGMHIESADGGRLGFWDGVARTWCILGKGLGYGIPVYNIIRLWKSYHQCAGSGENPLPWEEEQLFSITIMPLKWHCFLLCASAYLGLFGIMFASSFLQLYPPNRGELSVAEFAENYNYYLQYYGWNATGLSGRMDSSGQWVGTGSDSYMYPEVSRRNPSFQYYQKDGHIERITIIGELVDSDHPVLSFKPEMALALSAFAGGSAHIDPDTMEQVQNGMSEILTELPEGDFSFFVNNISVRGCQEMNGYNYFLDTYLVPDNDIASPYYRLECYLLKK